MKVRIAFATKPDGNGGRVIDSDRIGSIEDLPDGDAKELIKQGIAAEATEQDVADWEALADHRQQVAETEAAQRIESSNLNALTMDQLREQYPAAAEQPSNAKKADLIAAVEEAEASGGLEEGPAEGAAEAGPRKTRRNRVSGQLEDDGPAETGAPITTVAPGAESSPDVDPADRAK